jgi:hypothetical protein
MIVSNIVAFPAFLGALPAEGLIGNRTTADGTIEDVSSFAKLEFYG